MGSIDWVVMMVFCLVFKEVQLYSSFLHTVMAMDQIFCASLFLHPPTIGWHEMVILKVSEAGWDQSIGW